MSSEKKESEFSGFKSIDEVQKYLDDGREEWTELWNKSSVDKTTILKLSGWDENSTHIHNGKVKTIDDSVKEFIDFIPFIKNAQFGKCNILKWNEKSCVYKQKNTLQFNNDSKITSNSIITLIINDKKKVIYSINIENNDEIKSNMKIILAAIKK